MNKLIYVATLVVGLSSVSCTDFLDTNNLYDKNVETFYRTPKDIQEAMNGVYSALYVGGVTSEEHVASNLMSDLMFGGGGPDDIAAKNIDRFLDPTDDTYKDLWVETYNGVARANAIIEAVEKNNYSAYFQTESEAQAFKNRSIGEAYFMRGFLMFRAAKFFGGMPLILSSTSDRKAPRASYTETYSVIASDMLKAISLFTEDPVTSMPVTEYGHANIWVAKSFLARVFLYYTGYMTNIEGAPTSELPLYEGGALTKQEVINHLNDVITKSGFELTPDFRNLWPYSYVNKSSKEFAPEAPLPLPWAEENNLSWVGQDGPNGTMIGTGNKEVIFALRYGLANWDIGQKYNNRTCLFFGIRDYSMVPFYTGWGWGPVHPVFVDTWSAEDKRKQASVLTMGSEDFGTQSWKPDKGDENTGYINMKYISLVNDGKDGIKGMFYYLYKMNNGDPMQLWAAQDFFYMRFSDVLLMHSELSETADGLNKVRARAGLAATTYSLEAIKKERAYEFAFEGLRWFDLVRWGDVNGGNDKNYFGVTANVKNDNVDGVYSNTYRKETKGLVAVPESEIALSNGVYEQNPGW